MLIWQMLMLKPKYFCFVMSVFILKLIKFQVYDKYDNLVEVLSGHRRHDVVYVHSDVAKLVFTTDGSGQNRGWNLQWKGDYIYAYYKTASL